MRSTKGGFPSVESIKVERQNKDRNDKIEAAKQKGKYLSKNKHAQIKDKKDWII